MASEATARQLAAVLALAEWPRVGPSAANAATPDLCDGQKRLENGMLRWEASEMKYGNAVVSFVTDLMELAGRILRVSAPRNGKTNDAGRWETEVQFVPMRLAGGREQLGAEARISRHERLRLQPGSRLKVELAGTPVPTDPVVGDAVADLLEAMRGRLVGYVMKKYRVSKDIAEDVVQALAEKSLRGFLKAYDPVEYPSFEPFIWASLKNRAIREWLGRAAVAAHEVAMEESDLQVAWGCCVVGVESGDPSADAGAAGRV